MNLELVYKDTGGSAYDTQWGIEDLNNRTVEQ
jgi:hypothetical protein